VCQVGTGEHFERTFRQQEKKGEEARGDSEKWAKTLKRTFRGGEEKVLGYLPLPQVAGKQKPEKHEGKGGDQKKRKRQAVSRRGKGGVARRDRKTKAKTVAIGGKKRKAGAANQDLRLGGSKRTDGRGGRI